MHTIAIGIAEPQTICREGLHTLLEQQPGFEVIGEASDGEEATALVKHLRPHILILELIMPRASGFGALRQLKAASSPTRCLVLTGMFCRDELYNALQLGAYGWILKSEPAHLLYRAIRTVASGQYWIRREQVAELVEAVRQNAWGGNRFRSTNRFGLTTRELQMVAKIVEGYSNGDIAKEFAISERTVTHHLTNVFDKTGASTRLELAIFAAHHGLIDETYSSATGTCP